MVIESVLLLVPGVALGVTLIATAVAAYVAISCLVSRLKGIPCSQCEE